MNKGKSRSSFVNANQTLHPIRIIIRSTTGGQFQLSVSQLESVSGIKNTLARKLHLHVERMSLLYKDRLLVRGNLLENEVTDGCQLTLVPNMETGTSGTNNNCRVLQALENLTESQVNDFLTGRAPLLLAMKLGEHMMFVQLQLSAASCSARRRTLLGANAGRCNHISSNTVSRENPKSPCNPGLPNGVPGAGQGAVIDSVNHLGQGVYSGTFSGTLDPSVQDSAGRPKRDLNTILQILNDLLVATPQLRQSATHMRTSHEEHVSQLNGSLPGQTVKTEETEYNKTDESLRGKVQTLQKMMQERKRRRQEKRGLRAPYQWTSNRVPSAKHRVPSPHKYEKSPLVDREVTKESHTTSDAASFSTASATAMEQESVLV